MSHNVPCIVEGCPNSTDVAARDLARSLRMTWRCADHYAGTPDYWQGDD
jgi:hypothetical protein